MFTGIIEEVGKILNIEQRGDNRRITVEAANTPKQLGTGQSVAVSGVCLTALDIKPKSVSYTHLDVYKRQTTTHEVLEKLRDKADRKQIKDVNELKRLLKEELLAILTSTSSRPATRVDGAPEVIMVVGVNGAGKTTTIGKLAQVYRAQGKTVLMCAADTLSLIHI